MDRVQLILLCMEISAVFAQPGDAVGKESDPYMGARVTPSMAIIIIVLITAMFFMGFFSLYIRRCSDDTAGGSMRTMVAAVAGRSRRARGLDQAALQALPTFAYSEVKGLKIGKGALECAVCLNEFEDDETLRLIPKCDHVFHSECIDLWLASHTTCPVCRGDVSSTEPDPVPNPITEPESDHPNPPPVEISIPDLTRVDRPVRSWSMNLKPRLLSKFTFPRSQSTGHLTGQSAVHPERFTLRLPNEVRSQLLNRASSLAVLPREASCRKGGEGSSRGWFHRRVDRLEPGAQSDRWGFFFSRSSSMRSPKVAAEGVATSSTTAAEVVDSKVVGSSDTDRLPV